MITCFSAYYCDKCKQIIHRSDSREKFVEYCDKKKQKALMKKATRYLIKKYGKNI